MSKNVSELASDSVVEFFNQAADGYEPLIRAGIPRYDEIFWAMLYYLPADFQPRRILELGCGTGNLTRHLHKRWPDSHITIVDISSEMLNKTAENLPDAELEAVESYFEDLRFLPRQFDLVVASLSVHHMLDPDKIELFHKMASWLTPGGFFVLADAVKSSNERLYLADLAKLEQIALEAGANEQHIQEWRTHRDNLDHYARLTDVTAWLENAGFSEVNLLWRYLYNVVIQAQMPT